MESLGTSWSRASHQRLIMAAIVVSRVYSFSFVKMMFSDYRLLLTRRWKLVDVVMTVVMYRSQQHGQRGQRIVTRKPESGIVLTYHMGEIELVHVAFSLGKIIWWFPLAFSPCGVQGKLKFLLSFSFIISLRYYFVHAHIRFSNFPKCNPFQSFEFFYSFKPSFCHFS